LLGSSKYEFLHWIAREPKIAVFSLVKNLVNKIEDHYLIPKHSIVKEEEVPALLEKLNAPRDKLPVILKSDPAIKKLKPKKGDIIRIERNSDTAGRAVYYRVVR